MPPAPSLSSVAVSVSLLAREGDSYKGMARHIAHRLMISLPVLLGVLLIVIDHFLLIDKVTAHIPNVAGPTLVLLAWLGACAAVSALAFLLLR